MVEIILSLARQQRGDVIRMYDAQSTSLWWEESGEGEDEHEGHG